MENKKITFNGKKLDKFDYLTMPMALFSVSNEVSKRSSTEFLNLMKLRRNSKRKVEAVRLLKKTEKEINFETGAFAALKKDFHIDGAIKISEGELIEFNEFIEDSTNGFDLSAYLDSKNDLMASYVSRLGYMSGKSFIFRNKNYYFLLDGIDVEEFDGSTSVNDIIISNIDFEKFVDSICDQYFFINQQFEMFGNYVIKNFYLDLEEQKSSFCLRVKEVLSEEKILEIRKTINSGQFATGHEAVDAMFSSQWEDTLIKLERFRKIVEKYENSDSRDDFNAMAFFLITRESFFMHCKIVFGIDIDAIVQSHFQLKVPLVVKKMALGLMDAKMNILAFVQNVFQIVTNVNFLDPEYAGSLILERDTVRNIKKTCPEEFSEFKNVQEKYVEHYLRNTLLFKLDEVAGIFVKTLLKNSPISYLRLVDYGVDSKRNNTKEGVQAPRVLNDFIEITKVFFKLIQSFSQKCDLLERKKQEGKIKKGEEYFPNDRHVKIRQQVFKRLIRLYREENSPLVMIKTAQNALNYVLLREYDPQSDVLHIMSVNYGGALTGFFAKHVFLHTVKRETALINTASIIYSLYDVRNANSFARLTGYPFSNIIADENMTDEARSNFSRRNWLLIFDDNTNSGETLDNIRMLAKKTEFFGRIDMFPCRASYNLDNYKNSLNEIQKITMIVNSALEVRRAKANPKGLRYKELLGTIVGRRLWKIQNAEKHGA